MSSNTIRPNTRINESEHVVLLNLGAEGGSVSLLQLVKGPHKGQYVVIVDEGTLADFLDEDDPLRNNLCHEYGPYTTLNDVLVYMVEQKHFALTPCFVHESIIANVRPHAHAHMRKVHADEWELRLEVE